MEVTAKVKGWGRTLTALPAAQEPRIPRLGLQPYRTFPLGKILGSANPVGGVQGTPLTRKSCHLDGGRGRPSSAEAPGSGAVLRFPRSPALSPGVVGKGIADAVRILRPCCPGVLGLGDQGEARASSGRSWGWGCARQRPILRWGSVCLLPAHPSERSSG